MAEPENEDLLALTADIVAAHVGNNSVAVSDLPILIANVHGALAGLGGSAVAAEEKREPAISIRASVKPDYLVCLEDGKKLTMLKRYLRTNFDLSPADYRARWNLPADYPMVAPNYVARRRELAHSIGLGRKPRVVEAVPAPAPKARGRRKAEAAPVAVAAEAPKRRGRPKTIAVPTGSATE